MSTEGEILNKSSMLLRRRRNYVVLAGIGVLFACRGQRDLFPDIIAIKDIQAIHQSQKTFFETHGRYGTLKELVSDTKVQLTWASPQQVAEYRYSVEPTPKGYLVKALPDRRHIRLLRSFCSDESGVIREFTGSGVGGCSNALPIR